MGGVVMSRLILVGVGLLYPAYSSYKAVKGANVRQYVRWMMYWIVFALFTALETITDVFLSWLPFYYEAKILFVCWLALPYSRGASLIYRKFIHPNLSKREQEIDLFLENARDRSYQTVVSVGSRGINLAANAVVTAAMKGQTVVSNKLKSYSVADLTAIPEDAPFRQRQQPGPLLINPPVVREQHFMSSDPRFDHDDFSNVDGPETPFLPHYDTYPIMELGQKYSHNMHDLHNTTLLENDDFSTAPPAYTIDDMQITRRSNYAQESVPNPEDFTTQFYTMPRPKKGNKGKTKQMPPFPHWHEAFRKSLLKQPTVHETLPE